jgi:pyruvate dehydrogenase (quinone)/pyruvate oxidase
MSDRKLLEKAASILNAGTKIVLLVGQGALGAGEEILEVAEKLDAPIIKALLGKAVIQDDHPYCLGVLGMLGTEPASDAMKEADTLFMIGTSFPYIEYLPRPGQARGIQIDIKPEKIGLRYPVEVGLVGDSKTILSELYPLLTNKGRKNDEINSITNNYSITNSQFLRSKQHAMRNWISKLNEQSSRTDRPIKPQVIASAVSEELEDDAVISVDSGTNTFWAARFLMIRNGMKFSVSGSLATMANGLPYAIAAQVAFPERQCIAFVGDGGFTMLMGEFATAVQYNLPIKVIIIKNNSLGMIRWEQIAFLGNPEFGVELSSIDFVKFAEACGGNGYAITEPNEVKSVMHKAMSERNKPTIIEAYVDPFEPPMPPKIHARLVRNMAESFVKGEAYAKEIGTTLYNDKVHEVLKRYHSHNLV